MKKLVENRIDINRLKIAEAKLAYLKELSRSRHDRFVKKRKEAGHSRKNFWLPIGNLDFSELVSWLRSQSANDLMDFIHLLKDKEFNCRDLVNLYEESEAKKLNLSSE